MEMVMWCHRAVLRRAMCVLTATATMLPASIATAQVRQPPVMPWTDGQSFLDFYAPGQPSDDGGLAGGASGPQGAGDHIISMQCPSGGWNWPHGGCGSTFNNITAPICEGLLQAYLATGDIDFRNAASAGGNFDLTFQYGNGESRLSSFTAAFMRRLTAMTGNSAYSAFAETEFFDELTAGTYGPSDLNTATWIAALQAARSGGLINLRPWDLHQLPWVAGQIGNAGQQNAFRDALIDGLNTLDGVQPGVNPAYFGEILGFAGGVRGLALNGSTSFSAINSPQYALINGSTTLCQLANALASLQRPNGSWWWTANGLGALDEDTQTTAYAILALVAAQNAGCGPYTAQIANGRAYLASMQDIDGGYFSYPSGPHNIETEAEALWARAVASSVTLGAPSCTNASTVTVTINKSATTMPVVGGQFFLSYNSAYLSNPLVAAGDAPYINIVASNTATPGQVFVATSVSPSGGIGTTAATVMARITFTVVTDACSVADLVEWRTNVPPTRLTDADGNDILPSLTDLAAITLDDTPPTLTAPANVVVECDPSDPLALPAVPLCSAQGGVYIAYNSFGPEVPSNQSYFKAQFSQSNANGAHLFFDSALLPPYLIPGLTWQFLFSGLPVGQSQHGLDMVLLAPTYNGSNPPAPLIARDNTNSTCAGALSAGPVTWAINDYKEGPPPFYGPNDPARCVQNSLFRSLGLSPSAVTVTKNIVTQSGTIFTAEIAGILQTDNLIHWFNPATPDSPVSSLGLNGKFYYHATLTYNSAGDPGNDGDFYSGTLQLSANSPFTGAGHTVGVATVSDNCDSLPTVTFSDSVLGGACPQAKTITRTWQAVDDCGNISTSVQTITVVDTEAPTIVFCPPDITVDAAAGSCSTNLSVGQALYQDCCDASAVIPAPAVGTRSDLQPLNAPYPAGAPVTITWTATDACGNSSNCQQVITVNPVNTMYADLELLGGYAGTNFTRCIRFELYSCPNATPVIVDQNVNFINGQALGVEVAVPCGAYTCITARDRKHTLRRTANVDDGGLSINAGAWQANFTSAKALVSGNLNDDQYIDILDFGIFIGQYNNPPPGLTGSTLCGYVGNHADITGDGLVTAGDYTFIQINFLQQHEPACCAPPLLRVAGGSGGPMLGGPSGPITRISVRELLQRGMSDVVPGDINHDGWVDTDDIATFMSGGG